PFRSLRRRRLPGDPSRLRDPGGLRPLPRGRPWLRLAGDLGFRDEPHVRSAPVVPGRAPAAGLAVPRLLRLERHRPEVPRRAHHLPRLGGIELDVGSRRQGLLLAPLLPPPARSELREPRRPPRPPR